MPLGSITTLILAAREALAESVVCYERNNNYGMSWICEEKDREHGEWNQQLGSLNHFQTVPEAEATPDPVCRVFNIVVAKKTGKRWANSMARRAILARAARQPHR